MSEFDEKLTEEGIRPYFLKLEPESIVYLKFIFESYEGLAVIRTLYEDEARIVVMATSSTAPEVENLLESIKGTEVEFEYCDAPKGEGFQGTNDDWLLASVMSPKE